LYVAAVIGLASPAAVAMSADDMRTAVERAGPSTGQGEAPARGLHPAEVVHLRKLYIGLRKSAYDSCRHIDDGEDMASYRRCFHEMLARLVDRAGDPALARYHGYLTQIDRPQG
jgi:hypothetical protein